VGVDWEYVGNSGVSRQGAVEGADWDQAVETSGGARLGAVMGCKMRVVVGACWE
jgi:hypothetical protein